MYLKTLRSQRNFKTYNSIVRKDTSFSKIDYLAK